MKHKYLRIGIVFGVMIFAFISLVQIALFHHYEMAYFWEDIEGGLAGGTLLSILLMSYSRRSKTIIDKEVKIKLHEDESLLRWDVANFIRENKSCNGKLVLTPKRIIFKSIEMKEDDKQLEVYIKDITKVEVTKSLGILLNLLEVEATTEAKQFMIDNPKAWKNDMLKLMN